MSDLFAKGKKQYGADYQKHLFEQYKLYIESAEKTSDRRQLANNHFITINTAFVLLMGFFYQYIDNSAWVNLVFASFGVAICIVFYRLIRSYQQINKAKFNIIQKIEEELPLALYKEEWNFLKNYRAKGKYNLLSKNELRIVKLFRIIYSIAVIVFLSELLVPHLF